MCGVREKSKCYKSATKVFSQQNREEFLSRITLEKEQIIIRKPKMCHRNTLSKPGQDLPVSSDNLVCFGIFVGGQILERGKLQSPIAEECIS